MTDRVKTRIELEGAEAYVQKTTRATKSVKDLNDTSKQSKSAFEEMRAGAALAAPYIAAIGTAATVAIGAITQLGRSLYDLGMRGGSVSAVATAFERIASPELLGKVNEAAGGLSRNIDLMRESTQALRAGLVDEDEIARWYRAVTRGAQDTGESVQDMHRALGNMLSGGGMEEVLTKLGVNVGRIRDEMRDAGLSMESAKDRSVALDLALAELERATGGTGNEASNLNDTWARLANTIGDSHDEFARGFSESSRMRDVFRGLNEQLSTGVTSWQSWGSVMGSVVANTAQRVVEVAAAIAELNAQIFTILRIEWAGGSAQGRYQEWANRLRALGGSMAQPEMPTGITGGTGARAPSASEESVGRQHGPVQRGGGGRRGLPRGADTSQFMYEATESLRAEALANLNDENKAYEEQIDLVGRLYDEQSRALDRVFEQLDANHEKEQAMHDMRMDQLDEYGDAMSKFHAEQHRAEQARWESAQRGIGQLGEGVGLLTEIFQTIADAQDEETEKADKWRKVVGIAKGTFYAVEAVASAAEAVKQGASQNYAGMALGIAGAIKFGIASGYMFSRVAQSGGGGDIASSSSGTFTPTQSGRVSRQSESSEKSEKITVFGLGNTDAGVAAAVYRANRELIRSGRHPVGSSGGVGYYG